MEPWLRLSVQAHRVPGYSPKHIAGRRQHAYPDDMSTHLSAETIDTGLSVLPRGTLVERTTRLVILARMKGTDATSACQGVTKALRHVPAVLRNTLTYDRGKEMAAHEQLVQRLAIQSFFADPSVQSMATRHQREHQWPAAPVLALGHGRVGLHATRVERHRTSPEHAPKNRSRLCDAPGSLCATAP